MVYVHGGHERNVKMEVLPSTTGERNQSTVPERILGSSVDVHKVPIKHFRNCGPMESERARVVVLEGC